MWKLRVSSNEGPFSQWLFSTNNFAGRQIWEFDPHAGTPEERAEVEKARQQYFNNRFEVPTSGDAILRLQQLRENKGRFDLSIPPVKINDDEEVTYEATTITLKRAIRFYSTLQTDDGHWAAEIGGPMFYMPPLVIALYITGNLNTILLSREHIKESLRYMYCHQVLGIYDWSGCNPMPPEFWLLPSMLPMHPGKMWVYCRSVYMPMSYLYGKRFVATITDLILSLRDEIYIQPYCEINWNNARHACAKEDLYCSHSLAQNLLWDSLHKIAEPLLERWPFSKVREKALRATSDHLHYSDETTRYITTGCVGKALCMLASWVEASNSDAFKKHLARVPDYLWLAEDGLRMHSIGSQTWDTAFSLQALLASGDLIDEMRLAGVLRKGHECIKYSQVKDNRQGDFRKMFNHISKGAWTLSDRDHGLQVSDCTAEGLTCWLLLSQMEAEIVGEKMPAENLYDSVEFLLTLQSPNGGMAVWDPATSPKWLEFLNPSECFEHIVVEHVYVEGTASAVQALVLFMKVHPGHRRIEIENFIHKAVHFIESQQKPNGSWYGSWGICFIYATWYPLKGLAASGKNCNNSSAVRKGCQFLLSTQKTSGGWGESYLSCPKKEFVPLEGDEITLIHTAWALMGLIYAGQAEKDLATLHLAAKVLINNQMENGDFPQEKMGGVFMKNCMMHYASYRSVFPLMALGEYCRVLKNPRISKSNKFS